MSSENPVFSSTQAAPTTIAATAPVDAGDRTSSSSTNDTIRWQSVDSKGTVIYCKPETNQIFSGLTTGATATYKIGDFDYVATKVSNDRVQQQNTSTNKVRVFDTLPAASQAAAPAAAVEAWQSFDVAALSFIKPSEDICRIFSSLAVGKTAHFAHGQWSYKAKKVSNTCVTQTNESTHTKRTFSTIINPAAPGPSGAYVAAGITAAGNGRDSPAMPLLGRYKTSHKKHGKRSRSKHHKHQKGPKSTNIYTGAGPASSFIKSHNNGVWQFFDTATQKLIFCSKDISDQFDNARLGQTVGYKVGKWTYAAAKTSDTSVKQLNKQTGKVRIFTKVCKDDKDVIEVEGQMDGTGDNTYDKDAAPAGGEDEKLQEMGEDPEENLSFEFEKQLFQVTMPPDEFEIVSIKKFEFGENTIVHKQCYDAISNGLKSKYKDDESVMASLEQFLFHGTDWQTIEKIEKYGFNRDYNKRSRFGKGVYFAKYASISDQYGQDNENGERCMLLCNVIVGNCGKGGAGIEQQEQDKFDCLVDSVSNPNIFVVAKDYHCIPACTIIYKKRA